MGDCAISITLTLSFLINHLWYFEYMDEIIRNTVAIIALAISIPSLLFGVHNFRIARESGYDWVVKTGMDMGVSINDPKNQWDGFFLVNNSNYPAYNVKVTYLDDPSGTPNEFSGVIKPGQYISVHRGALANYVGSIGYVDIKIEWSSFLLSSNRKSQVIREDFGSYISVHKAKDIYAKWKKSLNQIEITNNSDQQVLALPIWGKVIKGNLSLVKQRYEETINQPMEYNGEYSCIGAPTICAIIQPFGVHTIDLNGELFPYEPGDSVVLFDEVYLQDHEGEYVSEPEMIRILTVQEV
jgi:hypothetical protein